MSIHAWGWRLAAVVGVGLGLLAWTIAMATGPAQSGGPILQPQSTDSAVESVPGEPTATIEDVDLFSYLPPEERPLAAFLGDSITRGMSDTDLGIVDEYSWLHGLLDDTTGSVRLATVTAGNGMSTAWMAGQVWTAMYPTPDLLIVHGGTNDVSGEITPPVVTGNLERIRLAAESVGVPLFVCTLPPRAEPEADARVVAVNAAIKAWAAIHGVTVLDTGTPLRDPVLGGWLPGYTTDGLHPTPTAAALMSEVAAKTLRQIPLGV
ncbi:MAG: SGNH/GDSL hydrolase family protein [Candidatus Nanopelagicales bacterium]|nr:SGNH/GDSL hydrolase family protein [Candidatus Nanopelagicales bacterium]